MKKKIVIPILVGAALITTGILVSSYFVYAAMANSDSSDNYIYSQTRESSEDLLIDLGVCDVIIGYNSTPMEQRLTVQLGYEDMIGVPQFSHQTQNQSTILIPKKTEILKVQLRTDIKYNLNILVDNGSIYLNVPENVNLGDVQISTVSGNIFTSFPGNNEINELILFATKGNIKADIKNGIIGEDITLNSITGLISASFFNVSYQQDCNLDIYGITGNIFLTINQHENMNANVEGSIGIIEGNILVDYTDTSDNVSADFSSYSVSGIPNEYKSPNHPADHYYKVLCAVITGNIFISGNE
jgi:hypothetical protein